MRAMPQHSRFKPANGRRAVAMLAFVAAVLVVGLRVLWLPQYTGMTSLSYQGHYLSSGAFYAAESGADLAMKEVKQGGDVDGNGVVGTISAMPALPNGSATVTVSGKIYSSTGVWQNHRRVTE